MGDVSSSKLTKTTMAKSALDASWASFKTMLDYKSQQAGIVYREINEAYTTRACSECGSLCGPQGIRALSVRDWQCVECGVQHDRDVNAARNILRLGAGHCAP
ncbi:transposase [Granulosicoccus antarcticus]|uniref:transposase n=1 Tax=Granulosicoccus antarcticus TaxID=437505 RepID=UPI001F24D898|nr:transposase [Granulosicoccus antarcticus]